jgi:hypothetical protein
MNATLSTRQLRLVILGVLVVVVAGGYLAVTRHKTSAPHATSSTPVSTPTKTTPAPSKAHTRTATPVKLDTHGLPLAVAQSLRKHRIVVVSLYSPGAAVDKMTGAEARAAAAAMGAGYVNLDVFGQRSGVAMLRKLGVTNTPVVLVLKRPANVYSEFPGFVDHTVVEQAVADAR